MADKIEPALTSEEWRKPSLDIIAEQITDQYGHIEWDPHSPEKVIAAANALLPDSDPRKITREMVAFLRSWQKECAESYNSNMEDDAPTFAALADALESYLPPA